MEIVVFFPSLEHFQKPLALVRKDPLNSNKLHEHPEVVTLFTRENWMSFFERIHGYDDEVTEEFFMFLRPHSKTHSIVSLKGLTLELTTDFISRITSLLLGLPWSKEEKTLRQVAKKTRFQPEEDLVENKNGVGRIILPPWIEVSYQIMKYITREGRFSIIFGYHFRLLHELRYGMDLPTVRKLNLPYFLLQSLIECGTKLNAGVPDQLSHHGLIKLLVEDALHTYTIPIAWEIFRNMSRGDDIKTLTEDISPYGNEEEEEKEEIEKEINEEE